MSIKRPLDHAREACATMMRKYAAPDLPPKGRFHYHQGVFLSGMFKTYKLCGDETLFSYIKEWVDSVISHDGQVLVQDGILMNDMQPGILLFPLIDRYNDLKYRLALSFLMGQYAGYPRNEAGGFWHKDYFHSEMRLDGLYMGGPLNAEYGVRYKSPKNIDMVVEQVKIMRDHTMCRETGLWYHAWDESRTAQWADPDTGQSSEFWGRAIGWVTIALVDNLELIPKTHPGWDEIAETAIYLLEKVCEYQSDNGRWYQIVNKGEQIGNWLETSCTCLFVASICKAVRLGLMDKIMLNIAKKGYDAIIKILRYEGEDVQIDHICMGTGVGDYKHYCERPTRVNDFHGFGAYILMCTEAEQVFLSC
jgi:unsaturated rhamnogalacturonyl hydrolase